MTTTPRVVDPHIHLWDLRTGICPHFGKPTTGKNDSNAAIARSYLLEEYLDEGEDVVAVEGAVHVEAFPTDPVVGTQTQGVSLCRCQGGCNRHDQGRWQGGCRP